MAAWGAAVGLPPPQAVIRSGTSSPISNKKRPIEGVPLNGRGIQGKSTPLRVPDLEAVLRSDTGDCIEFCTAMLILLDSVVLLRVRRTDSAGAECDRQIPQHNGD